MKRQKKDDAPNCIISEKKNNVSLSAHQLGQRGEKLARRYLSCRRYQIIDHNFRTKVGEIDLIAIENNDLVFIEVKIRKNLSFGFPEEAVTKRKINTIKKIGQYYIQIHPQLPQSLRLDVLAIYPKKDNSPQWQFHLFKNVS